MNQLIHTWTPERKFFNKPFPHIQISLPLEVFLRQLTDAGAKITQVIITSYDKDSNLDFVAKKAIVITEQIN